MSDVDASTVAAAAISLESIKGDIVTQTLDKLNPIGGKKTKSKYSLGQSAMNNTYELSKSVLSAVYEGKGTVIDSGS